MQKEGFEKRPLLIDEQTHASTYVMLVRWWWSAPAKPSSHLRRHYKPLEAGILATVLSKARQTLPLLTVLVLDSLQSLIHILLSRAINTHVCHIRSCLNTNLQNLACIFTSRLLLSLRTSRRSVDCSAVCTSLLQFGFWARRYFTLFSIREGLQRRHFRRDRLSKGERERAHGTRMRTTALSPVPFWYFWRAWTIQVNSVVMMRNKTSSSLQKTYDECYLICSTAVYFEGQVRCPLFSSCSGWDSWRIGIFYVEHH